MNKPANLLISLGIILIFGLIYVRDSIYGEPATYLKPSSIILCGMGLLSTSFISIPCIILGIILWQIFPMSNN